MHFKGSMSDLKSRIYGTYTGTVKLELLYKAMQGYISQLLTAEFNIIILPHEQEVTKSCKYNMP